MGEHTFVGQSCTTCGMLRRTACWWRMEPAGCPGVQWLHVRDLVSYPYLATRTALRRQHLNPGGGPVASYYSPRAGAYRLLYDVRLAHSRRSLTPRQRDIVETSLQAARMALTCSWCRRRVRSKSFLQSMAGGHRLCGDCERRWRCSQQARTFHTQPDHVVILDTETTGLSAASGDQVVELAILGLDGTVHLDTLVRPQHPIPPRASAIHGICDADVAGAPSFAEVYPRLVAAVGGCIVLIYNASFDVQMLEAECERLGLACPLPWENTVCIMLLYAEYVGLWSNYWHDYQWLPLEGGHRALADCQAVLGLVRHMAAIPSAPGISRQE